MTQDEIAPDEISAQVQDDVQSIEKEENKPLEHTAELTGEGDGREEFDWNNYLEDYGPVGVSYGRADGEAPTLENYLTQSPSLTEHLMWQMKLSPFNDEEVRVGTQIIGNLDHNGYLRATEAEIAALENVSPECVEKVLKMVQQFDPSGVAARNLQECLLIQAAAVAEGNQLLEIIIRDHLKELELKNYVHIARRLKVPLRDVEAAVMLISKMDPRPGAIYSEEKTQTIIPDVVLGRRWLIMAGTVPDGMMPEKYITTSSVRTWLSKSEAIHL